MSSVEMGEAYGGMRADWLAEKLEDFDCCVEENFIDDTLRRLNDLAATLRLANDDVVDGLIAFMLNLNRKDASPDVVEEFCKQESQKQKSKPTPSSKNANANALKALQRSILKEIPLSLAPGANADEPNNEDLYDVGCYCAGARDDYDMDERDEDALLASVNSAHTGTVTVKATYRGRRFAAGETSPPSVPTRLQLVSDCNAAAYGYGDANVMFDLSEIYDAIDEADLAEAPDEPGGEEEHGAGDEKSLAYTLTGVIAPADGGHVLSAQNAVLRAGATRGVPLNFDALEQFAIFPGKRVRVSGRRLNDVFYVEEIQNSEKSSICRLDVDTHFDQLTIFVACGPFAPDDAPLAGVAFANLLAHCARANANALILIGPFASRDSAASFAPDDVVASYLTAASRFVATRALSMRVLIVPSAMHDLGAPAVFPTPPYCCAPADGVASLHQNVTLLSDPAIFELEGVRVAVSASEIVLHLNKREVYQSVNAENEDRIQRLFGHLLDCASLYPLCPGDASLPLSLRGIRAKTALTKRPHILVLPSVLQPVIKKVRDCVVLNPGRFARGARTFASITVDLKSAVNSLDDAVSEFCAANIIASNL